MGWFKKKQPQEELIKAFGNAMRAASENAQRVQNAIFHKQRPYSDDFGLCAQNPIFTSSLTGTEQYLSKVCTDKWEKLTWTRSRSIRATVGGQQDVGEDIYTLYLNGEVYTELYFVMYCGESEAPPAGMYFYGDSTDWDIRREAYSKGITVNQLVEIRQMEAENKFQKEKAEREFRESVERKAQALKSKYPDVSIDTELQNDVFSFLAGLDVDLLVVYEFVHKEELLFKKESATLTASKGVSPKSFFDVMHQMECDEQQKEKDSHTETVAALHQEAARHGITIQQMIEIRMMEAENAKLKWEMRLEELQGFANQAVVVQSSHPNFNLHEDWNNLAFRKITARFGMLIAYEILHFSECYSQDIQSEIASFEAQSELPPEEVQPESHLEETQPEPVAQLINTDSDTLYCRKCGVKLMPDSAFCYRCGTPVVIIE